MGKYSPLGDYLVKQAGVSIDLTFQEIERILGFLLPASAYQHRAWWANTESHPQAGAWRNVGWKVTSVDFASRQVSLARPLLLFLQRGQGGDKTISFTVSMENGELVFVLSGQVGSATTSYSWQQVIQTMIKDNPHLFGNITAEPDHHIFPDMLAKLGYTVINWETGESWKGKEYKGI